MLDSVWVMVYGNRLMDEIAKYDISTSNIRIEYDGRTQTDKVVYGVCKNGFALYATHVVDTGNPLKDMDTYITLMVNHNKNIKLPKSKVISNHKFAKKIFDFMQNRYQNPVKLEVAQNVK